MRDKIFEKPVKKKFEFDEEVAAVFDDMITRSVPFYEQNIHLISKLIIMNTKKGDLVYDLGSSTGSLLINIAKKSPHALELIGIDNAEAMVGRARKKAKAFGVDISFEYGDILEYPYKKAQVVVANYTLQFIRPIKREKFVRKIYETLEKGGIFIFSEKIISEDKRLDKQLIEIYHDFKREHGYSDYEIAQKREALENVLVPFTLQENLEMVKNCGFTHTEPIFRWANFATFIAKK
ncbi:carboxy-S-adenosyl-L-methionine synthase CmoA [Nitratiruptor sp. YY09-18]|uniref:carboxy-S-adenosyl-L-methionine synthase CmoA n=1 Tax=Nitratiruptor sp. YY09-18 TaxID=2724901 RepID=UPI0019150FE5|nr:carboxy-S-adenosyl-L-methionine synthase CmoA [Nitratiruptor sp. YY09-18]BCD67872.1 tRNA (cmo5U34)-methyltransferase [Nitratiruptor sp. YY09-18]